MARRRLENMAQITEAAAAHLDQAMSGNELATWDLGDTTISTSMTGIAQTVMNAARAEVDEEYGMSLTPIQRQSVIATTAFRKSGALDLAAVYLRAQLLKYIQDNNLLSAHPGAQYESLSDMAQQNGCSVTEMSAILDLVNIVFPYIETSLELRVPDIWARLGKSKMKEMLPALKALITGDAPDTASTRASVEQLINNEFASMRVSRNTAGELEFEDDFEILDNENNTEAERAEVRTRLMAHAIPSIVNHLFDVGGDIPVAELRRVLRPDRNPEADFIIIQVGEQYYMLSGMNDRQLQSIRQRIGHSGNFHNVTLPTDPRQRQLEAMNIPTLRNFREAVGS